MQQSRIVMFLVYIKKSDDSIKKIDYVFLSLLLAYLEIYAHL